MEDPSYFKTLVNTYQMTQHDISGDLSFKHFLCINLGKYSEMAVSAKSCISMMQYLQFFVYSVKFVNCKELMMPKVDHEERKKYS